TVLIADALIKFYEKAKTAVRRGVPVSKLRETRSRAMITRMKFYALEELKALYETYLRTIEEEFGEHL
ncbi:MAG: hypothetical protein QXP64_03310, partial [Acidilobaceae archaeon]